MESCLKYGITLYNIGNSLAIWHKTVQHGNILATWNNTVQHDNMLAIWNFLKLLVTLLMASTLLITHCLVNGSMSGMTEFSQQTLIYKVVPQEIHEQKLNKASILLYNVLDGVVFFLLSTSGTGGWMGSCPGKGWWWWLRRLPWMLVCPMSMSCSILWLGSLLWQT